VGNEEGKGMSEFKPTTAPPAVVVVVVVVAAVKNCFRYVNI
jgi:hypothetical protein